MTTTISVSEVTKAKFDELRPDSVSSADAFLSVLLDYYEDGDVSLAQEARELPKHIEEQLDRVEGSAQTTEERTNQIQRQLEEMTR